MYNPGTFASDLLVSTRQLTPSGTYPRRPCGHPPGFPTCPCAALGINLTSRCWACNAGQQLVFAPSVSVTSTPVLTTKILPLPSRGGCPVETTRRRPRLALLVRSLFCPVPLTSLVQRLSYIVPESNRPHADPRTEPTIYSYCPPRALLQSCRRRISSSRTAHSPHLSEGSNRCNLSAEPGALMERVSYD
jgi:hypothetical protein